jgi:hypothetical protein
VAAEQAIYNPSTNTYNKQGTNARGVYTAGPNQVTPSPNKYRIKDTVHNAGGTGKGGMGVFKSQSLRSGGGRNGVDAPAPGSYNPTMNQNTNFKMPQSKATAAMRARSQRFGKNVVQGPSPGAYDPKVDITKQRSPYGIHVAHDPLPHYRQRCELPYFP